MNFRLAWVLCGVLLVAVAGLLVSTLTAPDEPSNEGLMAALGRAKEDDVDAVELVRAGSPDEKIVLARVGKDRWDVTEPGRGRANPFAVRKLIADLLALKPTPSKEVTGNKTVHGLAEPGLRVTLKAGDKSATLNVGNTTIGRNALTFVTTAARPDVPVAVQRDALDGLFKPETGDDPDAKAGTSARKAKWLSDFRQRNLLPGDDELLSKSESITVAKGSTQTKLVRNPGTAEWSFAAPPGYGPADVEGDPKPPPATFTGLRPLATALAAVQAVAPDDFIERPEALAKYGLDPADKETLRIEVKPAGGPPDVLLVGKRVDDKADKFFCKLLGDAVVVKATMTPDRAAAFARLAADPSGLRDRSLVPTARKAEIDAIDVAVGPGVTKLRRVPTTADARWVLYGGPTDPQDAGVAVNELLGTLEQPRVAKEVLTAPYDAVFAGPEKKAEVRVWYGGTERPAPVEASKFPPEPKLKAADRPSLTVIVGKKEADFVYVRRITADGIRTDMKLPDSALPTLTRDRAAYLDPRLKPFPPNTVKKLTIVRGGETVAVESDGKAHADQWKFVAPDRLKGQTADVGKVTELVNTLPIMNATRVAAESPADADLAKFGVGPAAKLKVTVGFDTPAEPDRVYEFGTPAEDKSLVYLRASTRPVVVTVPASLATRFAADDLRDRRLYQVDPAKVKAVELTGWKQALKQPTKYRFERAGGDWAVKLPAGDPGKIDPAKMEIFLATVAAPRAADYVPGGFKPEYGLDLANGTNALEIKLEIEGHPGIVLTLGSDADGGANFFAWTVARKDDVITLPAHGLREFKEKPGAFFK